MNVTLNAETLSKIDARAHVETDCDKLRDQFLTMPALCLTVAQTARLLNVTVPDAHRLLAELEHDHFLRRAANGQYHRREVTEAMP